MSISRVFALGLVVSFGLTGCKFQTGSSSHTGFNWLSASSLSNYVQKNETKIETRKKTPKISKSRKSNGKKSEATASRGRLHGQIARYARAEGVPVALAHAIIKVESNYRVNARGSVGEIGLMQIRLQTARLMGYRGSAKNLYNPSVNLKWGMKYLGKARKLANGNMCGTILRYNAGHGAKRMNKVSASYCGKIKGILRA